MSDTSDLERRAEKGDIHAEIELQNINHHESQESNIQRTARTSHQPDKRQLLPDAELESVVDSVSNGIIQLLLFALCAISFLVGLLGLVYFFAELVQPERFKDDNAYGATANAAERIKNELVFVRSVIFLTASVIVFRFQRSRTETLTCRV